MRAAVFKSLSSSGNGAKTWIAVLLQPRRQFLQSVSRKRSKLIFQKCGRFIRGIGIINRKNQLAYVHCQGRRNVGRAGGAEKKWRAMQTYEKQKKSLPIIRLVIRRAQGA